tara:strand:+ start:2847 stop:3482 length:636 start_codon:yes stop_codon:yes gene_type:complete
MHSDDHLTEFGMVASHCDYKRILIIACGALAREILTLIELNNWKHMALTCLPAKYHLYPEKITSAVEDAVLKYSNDYDEIFIAYADCGTGGLLANKCKDLGVKMIAGPHCYSFFEGNNKFANLSENEITAFYLTDFLVKQFDSFVWKPMGLDKHPELLDMYFGNYTKLVYQAQINDPKLDTKAIEISERMGLPLERRYTGYGDLETALLKI